MLESYAFGDYRIDVTAAAVTFRGEPVKLTAKCVAVLAELARRAPEVVSRAEFEAAVWPEGFIEASNLTQTIYMLRTAFARRDAAPVIDTHIGQGYRLALSVRRLAHDADRRPAQQKTRAFGRIASSLALGIGIACASAILATREAPAAPSPASHTMAHALDGGTLPLRASASPMR